MNNTLESIVVLFENVFESADKKLLDVIFSEHSKDIILTAPDIIISLYKQALLFDNALAPESSSSQIPYFLNRISIYPSHDWAVTLYHKDYSLSKDWRMKRRLIVPVTLKHTSKNKVTLYV